MNEQPSHTLDVLSRWFRQGAQQVRDQVKQGLDKHPDTIAAGREFAQAVKADVKVTGQQLAGLGRHLRTACADAAVACLSASEREALQDRLRRQRNQEWHVTDTQATDTAEARTETPASETPAPARARRTAARKST